MPWSDSSVQQAANSNITSATTVASIILTIDKGTGNGTNNEVRAYISTTVLHDTRGTLQPFLLMLSGLHVTPAECRNGLHDSRLRLHAA